MVGPSRWAAPGPDAVINPSEFGRGGSAAGVVRSWIARKKIRDDPDSQAVPGLAPRTAGARLDAAAASVLEY